MPTLPLSDELSINYEWWGDPEAPGVVLLHGFTADLRMWAPHVDALSEDYRVIAVDLRGHGRSSAPEEIESYTMEAYAEDVRALLDSLEVDVCGLIGCSFGGMVALQFAVTWPERVAALVISDSSPAHDSDRYDEAFRERERGMAAMGEVVARFGTAGLAKREAAKVSDPFLAEGLRKRYASMSNEGFLGAIYARQARANLIPLLAEKLTMPLLVCAGENDPVRVAAEVIAAEVPAAAYVMFRGAGHGVPVNRAAQWRDAILAFLGDVEDGSVQPGKRVV
ncbi:MAG: alpha/beta fold hydrolase [Dehalococcoidia bacterium]